MAITRLADELLQMILAPSLTIPRSRLVSSSYTAFGMNDTVSSACILMVCKRWLRVATPLLYETVIIRSSGQSHALADVFCRNPAFSKYVKKLRLEGAYPSLTGVVTPCINLTTLVLVLNIYSDANVTELCRALTLIDPAEVIVRDPGGMDNAKIRRVFMILCDSIPKWKNMTTFDFPYSMGGGTTPTHAGSGISRNDHLVDALSHSQSLREFYGPISRFHTEQWRRLAGIPSVTFKLYYHSKNSFEVELRNGLTRGQLSKKIVEFIDLSETVLPLHKINEIVKATPVRPFSIDAIDDAIWSNIFTFATTPYNIAAFRSAIEFERNYRYNSTRKALSLVCNRFERLVRPLFYAFPLLFNIPSLKKFSNCIIEKPILGREVHVLFLDAILDWHESDREDVDDTLHALLPHLVCLRHFYNSCGFYHRYQVSSKVFTLLAEVSGGTLLSFSIFDPRGIRPQAYNSFASFKCLQKLDVSDSSPYGPGPQASIASDSLSTLRALNFDGYGPQLDVFSRLRLPRLKSLSFSMAPDGTVESFLRASPRQIEYLEFKGVANFARVFRQTPDLLRLEWEPRSNLKLSQTIAAALDHFATHGVLKIITLNEVPSRRTGEKEQNNEINSFFDSLDLTNFPSLKEINFTSYTWPIDQRSIARQVLPKKAVEVKQVYGIEVRDKSGKPWRPRVQFKR